MSVPSQIETPKEILLELEVLCMVVIIGAWGGFVSYLLKRNKKACKSVLSFLSGCVTQIIISCFAGVLLGAFAIEKNFSFNMILIFSGVGGLFAGSILKIIGAKVKKMVDSMIDK